MILVKSGYGEGYLKGHPYVGKLVVIAWLCHGPEVKPGGDREAIVSVATVGEGWFSRFFKACKTSKTLTIWISNS